MANKMEKRGLTPQLAKAKANLSMMVRQMVPPSVIVRYHLAVLQNHNPYITEGDLGEWDVQWQEVEIPPTLADKMKSLEFLALRGWGQPMQSIHVEADIRQATVGITTSLEHAGFQALPYEAKQKILELIVGMPQLEAVTGVADGETTQDPTE